MITDIDLENWFTYHNPSVDQIVMYTTIREAALALAKVILDNTPECADQTVSIRKLRECVMTANAAIACSD